MYAIVCVTVVLVTATTALPTMFHDEQVFNVMHKYNFPFVTREEWNARQPLKRTPLNVPVPFVVIHHSYIPGECRSLEECEHAMRSMQNYHMDDKKWWDIGYNFGVGGDGAAYEGRGWNVLGAHSLHFNTVSIGICLIGDWRYELPPAEQLKTAKALIAAGVELGFVKPDYKLVGHRQVRETECPGDALYSEIQRWSHYSPFPNSTHDLNFVPELVEIKKASL